MPVRAKFTVTEHRPPYLNAPDQNEVILRATYDPDSPEDQRFARATPVAEIRMLVDNPMAFEQFTLGRVFYVDFIPALPSEAAGPVPTAVPARRQS